MIADVTTPYKNTIDTQRVPMNVAKLCTALLFLSPLTAYPEETPVAKLLLSSANDNEVKVQEQRTGFLKKGAYSGIPFIDDLELRFRNGTRSTARRWRDLCRQPVRQIDRPKQQAQASRTQERRA
jgi:hypothetical protein